MKNQTIIEFLKTIETFKTCERDCRTTNTDRAESDAEHSWHLAVFLMLLENELGNVDFAKILRLALIHDLPEIYAGDTNPYRGDTQHKEANEQEAADKLFSMLPEPQQSEFKQLFEEYICQNTLESQIVKSVDKLMPLIQNLCTNDTYSSYRKMEVRYEEVLEYMNKYFPDDGVLKNLYDRLLKESDDNGVFYSEPS